MPAIRTILHPTDFSESSAAAFELARALAQDYEARLVVLHAYPPPMSLAEVADPRRPVRIEEEVLGKLHDLVRDDRTVVLEYQVTEGRPAEVILDTAAREGCDLIVMGTRGRSGLRRAVMGSVAEEVSRNARCPVATVRAPVRLPREGVTRRAADGGTDETWADGVNVDLGAGD